jgi:cytidylate kinase
MKAITVTRQFGAGGGEVSRLVAERLGWRLLDQELLHEAANLEHLPDSVFESIDEKPVSLVERFQRNPLHQQYLIGLSLAARKATTHGGRVVLVGRGTRQLLGNFPDLLHVFLVAPREFRARRMAQLKNIPYEQALAESLEVDRNRDRFARYFFEASALEYDQYDLVINTARVPLQEVVELICRLVRHDWSEGITASASAIRVMTLARQMGAGNTGSAPTLGEQLGLKVYDRDILEHQAVSLGVSEAELEKVDEHGVGLFQRFRPGSLYQRYFKALERLMNELASRGDALIVGRGGSRFLVDHPSAFHVRLMASLAVRIQRVMEHRWLRQEPAQKLIEASDRDRAGFYESYFGANWADPLEYHLTVNTGRLGQQAMDVVAFSAAQHWARAGQPAAPAQPSPDGGTGNGT